MSIKVHNNKTYPFSVEDTVQGWANSGFDYKTTNMKARRVDDKVQIEITIAEEKNGRLYQKFSTIELSLDIFEKLVNITEQS